MDIMQHPRTGLGHPEALVGGNAVTSGFPCRQQWEAALFFIPIARELLNHKYNDNEKYNEKIVFEGGLDARPHDAHDGDDVGEGRGAIRQQ